MKETKKDALEVACKEYVELLEWTNNYLVTSNSADRPPCPILKDIGACFHRDRSCKDCIKRYFKEQATISDGWDVVKELYDNVNSVYNGVKGLREDLKEKLKQAGIEVE